MYGVNLFRLASLVGVRQVDIAALFRVSRVQVHYWAQGVRPVPKAHLKALVERIAGAVQSHLATGEQGRPPTRADLTAVLRAVFTENLHRAGHAPAPSLERFLEEVRRYAALTRHEQREGPQLAHLEHFTAMMLCWFELEHALLPLLRLLPDEAQTPLSASAVRGALVPTD